MLNKLEKNMNKLEKIEQVLKTNVNTFIDNTIEKCQGCVEVKDFTYSIHLNNDTNIISVMFDGGLIWDYINTHYYDSEDCDIYFCEDKATEIFGLDNLDWDIIGSYGFEIFVY